MEPIQTPLQRRRRSGAAYPGVGDGFGSHRELPLNTPIPGPQRHASVYVACIRVDTRTAAPARPVPRCTGRVRRRSGRSGAGRPPQFLSVLRSAPGPVRLSGDPPAQSLPRASKAELHSPGTGFRAGLAWTDAGSGEKPT